MSIAMKNTSPRHRISVDEYHRMGESGLIGPEARLELIDGTIVDMPPIGDPHRSAVTRLGHLMFRAVGDRAIVHVQQPVRLDDYSEPQPDLTLVKYREDFYESQPLTPADTLLVVEVSDSSLRYDLQVKMPLYARCGVPELWIVDLDGARLMVFRSLRDAAYVDQKIVAQPDSIELPALEGLSVDLSRLFGL